MKFEGWNFLIQLHVNATYYTQHPASKSVYEDIQSAMGGELFPSLRTGTVRALPGFQNKLLQLLTGKALVQKEAFTVQLC